ncbi:MAG: hypothetical protein FP826_09910 [Sphingomonadales bacterium]|nr:hypothetical protein [Sphingomonadales bacterium]MBU3992515.1 OB-fold domain-containing protein [Alphaproteobacteria bacterium]
MLQYDTIRPDQEFNAFLAKGELRIQRSRSSGKYVFYPRVFAPGTGADDLEWVPVSGLGTVYSFTVIRPRPPAEPYNVVLVDLDEGARIMSRVDDCDPADLAIGQRVKAGIVPIDGEPAVVFTPA